MADGIFTWRDRFNLGEPTVDAQHHQLLDLAGLLHEAAVRQRVPDVLAQGLAALTDYADVHFNDEEDLFAGLGSPLAAEHHAQHQALRGELAAMAAQIDSAPDTLPATLVHWVEHRLVPHMIVDDQKAMAAADALWGKDTETVAGGGALTAD